MSTKDEMLIVKLSEFELEVAGLQIFNQIIGGKYKDSL